MVIKRYWNTEEWRNYAIETEDTGPCDNEGSTLEDRSGGGGPSSRRLPQYPNLIVGAAAGGKYAFWWC